MTGPQHPAAEEEANGLRYREMPSGPVEDQLIDELVTRAQAETGRTPDVCRKSSRHDNRATLGVITANVHALPNE